MADDTAAASDGAGRALQSLKDDYTAYLDNKQDETGEQKDARRYYHGAQWTAAQVKALNARKQPVVTYNRINRKVNAIIGLLERQRQDPRGFPRTPQHEQGAELATAVLRYACDSQAWAEKSPLCGLGGAVDGLAGIELTIEQGDQGDPDIGMQPVDAASFFYDPRSLKPDFSDARYMGTAKWVDIDTAIEMFPDKAEELRQSTESGEDLTSNPDSDAKWLTMERGHKRVRLVDHWYIQRGEWQWAMHTGAVLLASGQAYLRDEKGRSMCRYIMYSANVDQDGDRYGFVRNMRSAQDEVNQRRSKALHIGNTRRMVLEDGNGLEVETVRREAARPDGVIVYPQGTTRPEFEDGAKAQELTAQLGFLEDAKAEIENFGFNPALIGTGVSDMSGRAIQLQQQAGIAELGPYILSFKSWKLRVYRALWNAIQQHWIAERWIRVTDDERVAQFIAINQAVADPTTGAQQIVNQLGALDVDIILDEGPDTINMQQDAYDTLTVMAQRGQQVPPDILIELSPLAGSVKQKILGKLAEARQQQAQAQAPVMQAQMAEKQAEIAETGASAQLKQAQAAKTMAEAQNLGAEQQMEREGRVIDLVARRQEHDFQREKGEMDLAGRRMDLMGKSMELQRRAEAQQDQAGTPRAP